MQPETAAQSLNAEWLVRLRWAAIAGQLSAVLLAATAFDLALPAVAIASVLVLEVLFNLVMLAWIRARPNRLGEAHLALQLFGDLTALTALLYFTGGPENPFNFLYLVHVTLASVVAPPRVAWAAALCSALAFGALFFANVPLSGSGEAAGGMHGGHSMHAGAGNDLMALHLRGMWAAFVVAATVIVTFVTRIRRALAEQSLALARSHERAERAERFAALGTLAAGAAHELSTPLASIAVAARELEFSASPDDMAEVATIRSQVERCRRVITRMSTQAGTTAGEGPRSVTLAELVDAVCEGFEGVTTEVSEGRFDALFGPLVTAIRPLLDNALAAAKSEALVRAELDDTALIVTIRDDGAGLTPEQLARVGEPFYTTKAVGEGSGLGVYLARSVAEQLGGSLHIESEPGRGTVVTFRVPAAPGAPSPRPT